MLYLLDANILITAENNYYGSEMVPEYWNWLLHMGRRGDLKIPIETYSEVAIGPKAGKDANPPNLAAPRISTVSDSWICAISDVQPVAWI